MRIEPKREPESVGFPLSYTYSVPANRDYESDEYVSIV